MLNDDVKLLNIVKQILIERNVDYEVPMSFDTIDGSILAQIVTIDSLQQKRIISRDLALELIADLFESLGTIQRFEKYCNEVLLKKYKELFFKYKTKFEDLLFELNVGRINQKEYFLIKMLPNLLNPEKRNGSSASSVCRSALAVRLTITEGFSCSYHEIPICKPCVPVCPCRNPHRCCL